MIRRAALLLLLAACGPKAPPQQPIAQSCPSAPHVVSAQHVQVILHNCDTADDSVACLEKAKADEGDTMVSVSEAFDSAIATYKKRRAVSKDALDQLVDLKKSACACKDADCANHVETDFETWMKDNEDTKGSQAEAEKAGELAGDIQECIAKALAGP